MLEITPKELLVNHVKHRKEVKRKSKTIFMLSFLLFITIILDIFIVNYFKVPRYKTLDVIYYEHLNLPQQPINCALTKHEIKSMLDDFYNIYYIYYEDETLDISIGGFVEDNTITINANLNNIDYLYALAHEITHIKYKITDETLTEYRTIVDLLESGNSLFEQVAMNRARLIVSGGVAGTEYDCGYYLLPYFFK